MEVHFLQLRKTHEGSKGNPKVQLKNTTFAAAKLSLKFKQRRSRLIGL